MTFSQKLIIFGKWIFPSFRIYASEISESIQDDVEYKEEIAIDVATGKEELASGEDPICESQKAVYSRFTKEDIEEILPSVSDDEDMPASTLRMWVLAVFLGSVVGAFEAFFGMRYPTVTISVVVVLVVSWPLGCLMHMVLPVWEVKLPWGMGFNLNPGPFNYKEHGCIFIFTNVVTSAGTVNRLVIEDIRFFEVNSGIGRQILFNMSCYVLSFTLIGVFRDILVTPEDKIWPGMLSRIALLKAFYSKDNPIVHGWKISRWIFLIVVLLASFVWYWVPDLLMPFTSILGGWLTWIYPEKAVLSQVFGVTSGLGLFPLTFDWAQVASINNPLSTPFWAVASMFFSFVFWIWIVMPGLYYNNYGSIAYFPIITNKVYTVDKEQYSFKSIVDKNWNLVFEKYEKYSSPMLSVAFLMNLSLSIGVFASLLTHFILLFPNEVIKPWKERSQQYDWFNIAANKFKSFPRWIYIIFGVVGLGLGFTFCEALENSPMESCGFVGAVAIATALYVPLSLLEARANSNISISSFFYIVSANWFKGNPFKLLYFASFIQGLIQHAMHMAQGAKVGHYLRIDPKTYMTVLCLAGIWGAIVSPSVTSYLLYNIKGICTEDAVNNMTCRSQVTSFNVHSVWGLFGCHLFVPGGRYSWVLWFFLLGAVVSLVQFLLVKWKGKQSIFDKFDPVLFFGGADQIPGLTGYNYSTWFITALLFNYIVHRKFTAWWRKYNLVAAIGLDCGVAIAILVVYFSFYYTGAFNHFQWWGTKVGKSGCDTTGCPYLNGKVPAPQGF